MINRCFKGGKAILWKRIIFSTNGAGTTGEHKGKKMNFDPYPAPHKRFN